MQSWNAAAADARAASDSVHAGCRIQKISGVFIGAAQAFCACSGAADF
jgi:hypothetical protein